MRRFAKKIEQVYIYGPASDNLESQQRGRAHRKKGMNHIGRPVGHHERPRGRFSIRSKDGGHQTEKHNRDEPGGKAAVNTPVNRSPSEVITVS